MQKYNCVQFTLRPRGGVTDRDISVVKTFITKWCQYYHVITEKKDEERHIHCALILNTPATVNSFNKKAKRKFEYICQEDRGLMNYLYKGGPWYNEDWYVEYCDKGDDTVVVMHSMCDQEARLPLYIDIPPEERRNVTTADPYLAKLERLWIEDGESLCRNSSGSIEVKRNCYLISRWISRKCFKDRVLKVIYDERRMRRVVKMLLCYLAKGELDYIWGMTSNGQSTVHGPPIVTRQCEDCRRQTECATSSAHHYHYD